MKNVSLIVRNRMQPRLLVLSASRGCWGPNWRWLNKEPAERESLGSHTFNSPKAYRDGSNLIIDLASSGFLALI